MNKETKIKKAQLKAELNQVSEVLDSTFITCEDASKLIERYKDLQKQLVVIDNEEQQRLVS